MKTLCRKFRQKRLGVAAVVSAVLLNAATALADTVTSFTLPTVDLSPVYTLGGTVLGGLAVMWVLRKLIKTTNKS